MKQLKVKARHNHTLHNALGSNSSECQGEAFCAKRDLSVSQRWEHPSERRSDASCLMSSSSKSSAVSLSQNFDTQPYLESRQEVTIHSSDGSQRQVDKKEKRKVSFSTVEIRYHEVMLGDNPQCHCGPPIQVRWQHFASKTVNLDNFEKWRRDHRRHGQRQLFISPTQRHLLLIKNGTYKSKEINDAIEEIEKIKKQRKKSITSLKWKRRLLNIAGW